MAASNRTIVERLVYVKYLYHIARDISKSKSPLGTSLSVVTLDNSVENFLWIVINHKRPQSIEKLDNFPKVVNEAADVCGGLGLTFDKDGIMLSHKARNAVQHSGILLDKNQAAQFFVTAEKLVGLSSVLFNVAWNDVSMSLLIEHPKISQLYREAELAFVKGNYQEAANKTIISFELAKKNRQANQFGSGLSLYKYPLPLFKFSEMEKSTPKFEEHSLYLDALYAEVEVLKLGLDYKRWRDYRMALGTLDPDKHFTEPLFPDNNSKTLPLDPEAQAGEKVLLTATHEELKQWLEYVMPFALQSILQWQETTGFMDFDMVDE